MTAPAAQEGDLVTLLQDWVPKERSATFLVVGVQTVVSSEWTEQAHLLRVEHMPGAKYPTGGTGAHRVVPLHWLKVNGQATKRWKEANA